MCSLSLPSLIYLNLLLTFNIHLVRDVGFSDSVAFGYLCSGQIKDLDLMFFRETIIYNIIQKVSLKNVMYSMCIQ